MAPTLVLLHGFTHTGESWGRVVARLPGRYRALAPDVRGHGASSEAEPVTLEAVIADIAALAPPQFTLAGYSMGGRIALHVALAMGERAMDPLALGGRVKRLVLIGASAGIADPTQRAARCVADERLAAQIEGARIEEFAARWAATPVLTGLPPAVAQDTHADRLRNTPAGLARALRGLGAGALPSLWDRLGELRMPVTLVVGERDRKFRAIAEEMAVGIPQAEVVVVSGAGHAVHLEAPERVATIIAAG
jgi:2-succinyl-6-hydroxy-2,4-cyclohexadiene-1-carboxylate synthase